MKQDDQVYKNHTDGKHNPKMQVKRHAYVSLKLAFLVLLYLILFTMDISDVKLSVTGITYFVRPTLPVIIVVPKVKHFGRIVDEQFAETETVYQTNRDLL